MRFTGDEAKFMTCYDIKPKTDSNKITYSSKYTDIVKTMLASLSLLLKMDLESLISSRDKSINLERINDMVITATNRPKLMEYFTRIINGEEIYFDDFDDPCEDFTDALYDLIPPYLIGNELKKLKGVKLKHGKFYSVEKIKSKN